MYNEKGSIFNIQRFSTSDGPGIRTVVFFKGCPLDCAWCHNPESKKVSTDVFYKPDFCIGCKACFNECSEKAHLFTETEHTLNRTACISCGKCANVCATKALEICGKEMTVKEVMDVALSDKPFYEESGGGITLSGGEPLLQFDFALNILKSAKENGVHTCVETCGFTEKPLEKFAEYVDLWLYDIKLIPEAAHKKYTGVSNKIILKNLDLLDELNAKVVLRCPIIPDVNMYDEHFKGILDIVKGHKNIIEIDLEAYHPLGVSKAEQLGKTQAYDNKSFLNKSELEQFANMLKNDTDVKVVIL